MLKKIISGGQSGADIAGLMAAKLFNIPTGGYMPQGWKTLDGPKPEYAEMYGMEECNSRGYPPRTYANVRISDGTIRIARNFDSPGEKCTLKAIKYYDKPYFDVDVNNITVHMFRKISEWLKENNIKILNVAGNTEQTAPGMMAIAYIIMATILSTEGHKCTK